MSDAYRQEATAAALEEHAKKEALKAADAVELKKKWKLADIEGLEGAHGMTRVPWMSLCAAWRVALSGGVHGDA